MTTRHQYKDTSTSVNDCQQSSGCGCSFVFWVVDSCSSAQTEHLSVLEELSDEYTTAQLIADTVAALNHYCVQFAGDANRSPTGTCSAFRDLSTDEVTYTIRRTKWKVRHFPTASCYLKVWIRKRFRPKGGTGATDVFTDLASYVWNGQPTEEGLCFADSEKVYSDVANRIDSAATEELEPPTNGTTTIEIKKWSCLEGYEPDDPLNDGNRPNPDLHPNSWPPAPVAAP